MGGKRVFIHTEYPLCTHFWSIYTLTGYLVALSQGRRHSHLEDEEKWSSSLPGVTVVKCQRQDQNSEFPILTQQMKPAARVFPTLCFVSSQQVIPVLRWTLLFWYGPQNAAQMKAHA